MDTSGTMKHQLSFLAGSTIALFVLSLLALALSLLGGHAAFDSAPIFAMAILASTHPTLLDLKARLDENDKIAQIIETLAQTNEAYEDMVMLPGTDLTGIETTVRTGIPEPTWRKMYGGVQPTKSTAVQIREGCGMLEDYSEIDKALADLNGNSAAWRMSEDLAKVQGFAQKVARYTFYGNEGSEPEAFTGLAPRYNSLAAMNAENILQDTTGSGSNNYTSMWVGVWSQMTGFGFYPKGSQAGLKMVDKGDITIENIDGAGGRMEAYRTHYRQDMGLAIRDWRYFVRVQFRLSAVTKAGTTGAVLGDMLAKALRRIPNLSAGRAAIYMNRSAMDAFDLQGNNHPLLRFTSQETAQGKFITTFRGIPVRRVDQLLDTEAAIV
jgi:hypothetical protein